MSECSHDCSNCTADCASRNTVPQKEKLNAESHVKHVVAVTSGKGGVGKSFVTASLASRMQQLGYQCAILDADVTGPSIAKCFGLHDRAMSDGQHILPQKSQNGIDIISVNMMLETETTPVIWRGPVIAGVVKQFWTDVLWKDIDYLFIDMPPGTGDVQLTVFQSIPVDTCITVTTPQDLVEMIVTKSVNMAREMNIPMAGIIENMSYITCPDCGKKIHLFGDSKINQVCANLHLPLLASLPIDPSSTKLCDQGNAHLLNTDALQDACVVLSSLK